MRNATVVTRRLTSSMQDSSFTIQNSCCLEQNEMHFDAVSQLRV